LCTQLSSTLSSEARIYHEKKEEEEEEEERREEGKRGREEERKRRRLPRLEISTEFVDRENSRRRLFTAMSLANLDPFV
jgi:hypothetical protein